VTARARSRSRWRTALHAGCRGEDGAGSVLVLAMLGVVVVLGLALGSLGAARVARAGAQSAADLAALAAADQLALGRVLGTSDVEGACARAREVAVRNGASVESCAHEGGGVVVVRVARVTSFGPARAAARAGPASARSG